MADISSIQTIDGSTFRSQVNEKVKYVKDQDGKLTLVGVEEQPALYPEYLPVYDSTEKMPPLEPFEFIDRGSFADAKLSNLFPEGKDFVKEELSPKFGSEVSGIQLSQLSDKAKDELALFVAQRGVVLFRDQDFKDLGIAETVKYVEHFGPLHIHPTSGAPRGYPQYHVVHVGENDDLADAVLKNHTSSASWHSDVSYERQPVGITFLTMLETPESGGDTIFADCREAYNRLSPAFQERLHGLKMLHSAKFQALQSSSSGGIVRRDPVENEHPIVRTHPVTKEKSLYMNHQFGRQISQLKFEESNYLTHFLDDHVQKGADFQVRARWKTGTVAIWDNRICLHSALLDWGAGHRRHAVRLAVQSEIPSEEL